MSPPAAFEMNTLDAVTLQSSGCGPSTDPGTVEDTVNGTWPRGKGKNTLASWQQNDPSSAHWQPSSDVLPATTSQTRGGSASASGAITSSYVYLVRSLRGPRSGRLERSHTAGDARYSLATDLESGVGHAPNDTSIGSSVLQSPEDTAKEPLLRSRSDPTITIKSRSSNAAPVTVSGRKSDASRSNKACLLTIAYLGSIAGGLGILEHYVGPLASQSNGIGGTGALVNQATPTPPHTLMGWPRPTLIPAAPGITKISEGFASAPATPSGYGNERGQGTPGQDDDEGGCYNWETYCG
ncbi:hypothetical protein I316_03744 [Kwoniella heveanensis BCC8398]|uniref:Uncharacterized protein n=1 Tax=Kwoniella heveanensis BCC8398 TaxID=1296120 RepID=A0A1B9GUH4_9TREE|nr:hypothetical protein I316_03744 [Kwoniella heveanensis BCC8398]